MTNITQADRLEPCPFCGAPAEIASPDFEIEVHCTQCAAKVENAPEFWNARISTSPNIPEVGEDVVERAARAAYLAHHPRNKGWLTLSLYQRQQWAASARAAITVAFSTLPLGYKDGLEAADGKNAWQPIETAPREGKAIIFSAQWGVAEGLRFDGGKWGLAAFNGAIIQVFPTHWQPLPTGPSHG